MIPLHDGLLITGRQPIRLRYAEWTILVTLQPPYLPSSIFHDIVNLQKQLKMLKPYTPIEKDSIVSWSHRLDYSKSVILSSTKGLANPMIDSSPTKRCGLLDFGGELLHTVFGTATDKSVEDCRRLVRENKINHNQIIHKIDKLVTLLNRVHEDVRLNRVRLIELSSSVKDIVLILKLLPIG